MNRLLVLTAALLLGSMFNLNSVFASNMVELNHVVPPATDGNGEESASPDKYFSNPDKISNVRIKRVYKNGTSQSNDDTCIITFEYENKTCTIELKYYELCDMGYIDCTQSKNSNNKAYILL